MIEFDIMDDLDEDSLPAWLIPRLAAWRKFKVEAGFSADSSEKKLYHPTLKYAGTADLFGRALHLPKLRGRGVATLEEFGGKESAKTHNNRIHHPGNG
jgi:hypothetical protein